jgi:speckle-type POZ protein
MILLSFLALPAHPSQIIPSWPSRVYPSSPTESSSQVLPREPSTYATASSGYHLLVVEGYLRTYSRAGDSITSRSFTIGGHRWCIYYYPQGRYAEDAGFISLFLSRQDGGPAVKVQFEFSFVDETEKQDPARIRASRVFETSSLEVFKRFMKRDALQKPRHFKDDGFTIRCDVMVAEEDVTPPLIDVPPSDMKQNFTDLLLAGEGTDVVFQVGGETFAAHRSILGKTKPTCQILRNMP